MTIICRINKLVNIFFVVFVTFLIDILFYGCYGMNRK
nr:MAG TPA: Zn2+ transporter ZntB-like subfamily protein [Caudoviricetes sp.]